MTNEAAERLHKQFCKFSEGIGDAIGMECAVRDDIDAALAAERKATVERIREALEDTAGPINRAEYRAILDAEAKKGA